ncbi:MAG: hypothetical protein PVF85_05680 [Anaerolineales bacterium]|jgi:hypothetical protein
MDNPHVLFVWGQLDMARKREAVELFRLYRLVRPERVSVGRVMLRHVGSLLVRSGLKLERMGKAAAVGGVDGYIDKETLWKASRQAA